MKKITLGCRTAGFQFGDTVEVGDGKDKISTKIAQGLVDDGLAKEVVEQVAKRATDDSKK